jgi:hypothetical protein
MAAEYSEAGTKWEPLKGAKRVHSGLAFLLPRAKGSRT